MIWHNNNGTWTAPRQCITIPAEYLRGHLATDAMIADAIARLRTDFPGFTLRQIRAGLTTRATA